MVAQRRAEAAQSVPISLVALDGGEIERQHITDILDLQKSAPGLNVQRGSQTSNTKISIRGVGSIGNTAIEPSVATFVDGVYIARPGAVLAGLNDVASVEVLRGPQGTLFGRNASVGAISFHTGLPSDKREFEASGEYGRFDRTRVTALANLPFNEVLSVRVSALYDDFEGYGDNLFAGGRYGGQESLSVRGAAQVEISPSLSWVVRADYQEATGDGAFPTTVLANSVTPTAAENFTRRLRGLTPTLDDTYSYDLYQTTAGSLNDDQWGVSSELSWGFGDFSLKLISAYRDWDNHQVDEEATLTPADLFGRDAEYGSQTHSEELQLVSPDDLMGGRLSFVSGLYYFDEDYRISNIINLGANYCDYIVGVVAAPLVPVCRAAPQAGASRILFDQTTQSYAAYGQATYVVAPSLRVTAGLRYSYDDKQGRFLSEVSNPGVVFQTAAEDEDLAFSGGEMTYRLNAVYTPAPNAMLFATYSTGYKSGGFDTSASLPSGSERVFEPETVQNYEAGAKTQFFRRRLTANATVFLMDVEDFQLRAYEGLTFRTLNAGSLRQQGVEFEVAVRPAPGLKLGVSGVRLDSRYTDFRNAPGLPGFGGVQDLTGTRAPNSPKWQGAASIDYYGSLPGTSGLGWSAGMNLSAQSDSDVGSSGDGNPQGIQAGYALLSARASLYVFDGGWEVYVSGQNLTDERYCTTIGIQALNGPLGLNDPVTGGAVQRCVLGAPRTLQVGTRLKF